MGRRPSLWSLKCALHQAPRTRSPFQPTPTSGRTGAVSWFPVPSAACRSMPVSLCHSSGSLPLPSCWSTALSLLCAALVSRYLLVQVQKGTPPSIACKVSFCCSCARVWPVARAAFWAHPWQRWQILGIAFLCSCASQSLELSFPGFLDSSESAGHSLMNTAALLSPLSGVLVCQFQIFLLYFLFLQLFLVC